MSNILEVGTMKERHDGAVYTCTWRDDNVYDTHILLESQSSVSRHRRLLSCFYRNKFSHLNKVFTQ